MVGARLEAFAGHPRSTSHKEQRCRAHRRRSPTPDRPMAEPAWRRTWQPIAPHPMRFRRPWPGVGGEIGGARRSPFLTKSQGTHGRSAKALAGHIEREIERWIRQKDWK